MEFMLLVDFDYSLSYFYIKILYLLLIYINIYKLYYDWFFQ